MLKFALLLVTATCCEINSEPRFLVQNNNENLVISYLVENNGQEDREVTILKAGSYNDRFNPSDPSFTCNQKRFIHLTESDSTKNTLRDAFLVRSTSNDLFHYSATTKNNPETPRVDIIKREDS